MGRSQVASHETDVTIDRAFKNNPPVSSAQLATNRQLCSSAYRGHCPLSLAAGRILLDGRLQN